MFSDTCKKIENNLKISNERLFKDVGLLSGHPWENNLQAEISNYYSCLYHLSKSETPTKILEIGTAFGLSTSTLLKSMKNIQLFITIDLGVIGDQYGFSQNNIDFTRTKIHSWCCKNKIALEKVRFYRANTQPEGLGDNSDCGSYVTRWHRYPDLLRLLLSNDFDVIFVDGKHTGNGLYNDLVTFWGFLKEGGIIICDDLHEENIYKSVFPWAGDTLRSFKKFEKSHLFEIEDSFIWEYPRVPPANYTGLRPFGMFRKKQHIVQNPLDSNFNVFDYKDAIDINRARLDHLASLGLDFINKDVIEVGAGIGKHTTFFEKLGCNVISTDIRYDNVQEILRRYPYRNGKVTVADLSIPGDHKKFGKFDIVYCYGVLYHLENPSLCLEELSDNCNGLFLLETCVNNVDNGEINIVDENANEYNQSYHGKGCRPGRDWTFTELKKYYPYVYSTRAQPIHPDFPLEFPVINPIAPNARAIFVASTFPIYSSALLTELPNTYIRQDKILTGDNL